VTLGSAREAVAGLAGELYALYTLKSMQGTGAGRQLFDAARQSLRACGINGMYLWVLADNPSAGFYRHMGGRAVMRKTIDIGGKPLEEIAYGWPE
jgi:GNAT superfamily N-acetyltransferase